MVRWDCVVVGGGLTGAVMARRLAEADKRVLVVERGRAVSQPPGAHLRNSSPYRDDPDGYFAAIDPLFDYLDCDAEPSRLPGAFTTNIDGGMGIVWTNNCPRAVDGVDRPDLIEDQAWDRCYDVAERYLAVRADEFDDSDRARFVADRLGGGLAAEGRALQPLPLAGHREESGRIRFIGPADVLASVVGVERRDGEVERLEMSAGGARGARVDGESIPADHVVVAAGAVETPLLLWRSGLDPAALGRNLSYHPVLIGQVVLDQPGGSNESDPSPRLGIPPTPRRPWFTMLLRDTNPFEPAADDGDVDPNRLIEIQAFCPVDPDPAKRMLVDDEGRISFDVPLRPADEKRREEIVADVDALCAEIGRWRRGCHAQWAPLGTPHLTGSCRMGTDPSTSVTDPSGSVRGVENLTLAGNGVIPGRLAVNPTLTAAALAVHAADAIIGRAH